MSQVLVIHFQMQKGDLTEDVKFSSPKTDEEIEEYFENACGGVFMWWRTGDRLLKMCKS